jgi:hypothetical protein
VSAQRLHLPQTEHALTMVSVEKQVEACLMHHGRFGERQRFANKAGQTLSQRIVPPFDMGRFSCVFSHSTVLLF